MIFNNLKFKRFKVKGFLDLLGILFMLKRENRLFNFKFKVMIALKILEGKGVFLFVGKYCFFIFKVINLFLFCFKV